uniref:Secreted protein n=1 Tax=Neolamprologus brichardi TaxID=32507 RepID=A0A3Q4MNE2_NEOBR
MAFSCVCILSWHQVLSQQFVSHYLPCTPPAALSYSSRCFQTRKKKEQREVTDKHDLRAARGCKQKQAQGSQKGKQRRQQTSACRVRRSKRALK